MENIKNGLNVAVAKSSASFDSLGLDESNIVAITKVDGTSLMSWKPIREINAINGFESGKGYYIVALAGIDLTAVLIPPISVTQSAFPHTSNFTAADDTNIVDYTPDTGIAWVPVPGSAWKIKNNRLTPTASANSNSNIFGVNNAIGQANVKITVKGYFTYVPADTHKDVLKIRARITDENNLVVLLVDGGTIALYDVTSGTPTAVQSVTQTTSDEAEHTYELNLNGNTATVKKDGATVITSTLPTTKTGTTHGLGGEFSVSSGGDASIYFDNFQVAAAS